MADVNGRNWEELSRLINLQEISQYFPEIFEIFSNTSDGKYVYVCYIPTNYSIWSKEAVEYFGLDEEFFKNAGDNWLEHIHPDDRELYRRDIEKLMKGEKDAHNLIYRARNKEGHYITCTCRGAVIRDEDWQPRYFLGTITNHEYGFFIDPVTGLFGRNSLIAYMESYAASRKPYFLLAVGIHNFSGINTTYGYSFGNKVLKTLAEYAQNTRGDGVLFRVEGTKTMLLLECEGHNEEDISGKFERVRKDFSDGIDVEGINISLDICGGLAVANDFSLDVNTIYNNALFALDKAKRENETKLLTIEKDMFDNNQKHVRILNKIRNSIKDGFKGFFLVYQPIVEAESEKVSGMEALLRWKSPEYGFVPPNEFIPWLEKDTLFFELGNWIIRTAMEDAKKVIANHPGFTVNVNLAYPQLQRSDFKDVLNEILKEQDFPPDCLKLELTERCRLLDMDVLKNDMLFFKSEGMQTALDDFGTGYAALNLMTELPVDQIKIDKSFIDDIVTDVPKQCLLRAITGCARELGKNICIEGVETQEMAAYLRMYFSVTHFQGYYYSRPVPIDGFIEWLEKQ